MFTKLSDKPMTSQQPSMSGINKRIPQLHGSTPLYNWHSNNVASITPNNACLRPTSIKDTHNIKAPL